MSHQSIKHLVYVSQGNIPSRKAHTTQACHMASAFSELVPRVELVTQAQVRRGRDGGTTKNIAKWYGLPERLKIRRLPVTMRPIADSEGFIQRVPARFARYAALYCRLRRPHLVYTRLMQVALETCRMQLPTALETHDPPADAKSLFAEIAKQAQQPYFRGLVTVSPVLRELYVKHGVPENKILVSPDAANTAPFDAASTALQKCRRGDRLVVGYCGHFYEGRGIDSLLECARSLPHIDLRLVGGYPEDIERYQRRS